MMIIKTMKENNWEKGDLFSQKFATSEFFLSFFATQNNTCMSKDNCVYLHKKTYIFSKEIIEEKIFLIFVNGFPVYLKKIFHYKSEQSNVFGCRQSKSLSLISSLYQISIVIVTSNIKYKRCFLVRATLDKINK